jgi:hypothetical protein
MMEKSPGITHGNKPLPTQPRNVDPKRELIDCSETTSSIAIALSQDLSGTVFRLTDKDLGIFLKSHNYSDAVPEGKPGASAQKAEQIAKPFLNPAPGAPNLGYRTKA